MFYASETIRLDIYVNRLPRPIAQIMTFAKNPYP